MVMVSIADFTSRVETYKNVVDLIKEKSLHRYLYYPVRNYDLLQFIKKINWFCIPTNEIIRKIARKEDLKALERSLQNIATQSPGEIKQAIQIVDKNIAKAALLKAATALKTCQQKQNLSAYTLKP
jgi:hypothetical protein